MPDEDEEEVVRPQDSKCWTCRHGMVLHENDMQTFMQPSMVPGNPFEGESEEPGMSHMSVEISKIRSVCYWRGNSTGSMFSPLVFNKVVECSRYETN